METNSKNINEDLINRTIKIPIYTVGSYDLDYFPAAAIRLRKWWEEDDKTKNHARFCLPMIAANSYGFYILSPADITFTWDGNIHSEVVIDCNNQCSHANVTTHSANGSFTIQAQIIPRTPTNVMTYIKPIPNMRLPFQPLEGLMETWWLVNNFGIVSLATVPGTHTIKKGQPIAQMLFIGSDVHNFEIYHAGDANQLEGRHRFIEKRNNYSTKELDYMKGLHPDGTKEPVHYAKFKNACPFHKKLDL